MRKPLVVVCAAASALLLAGGVVATSASADERPDVPSWSNFFWPSLFGGDSSPDDDSDDSRNSASDPFADRGAPERPMLDDSTVDGGGNAGPAARPHRAQPDADAAPAGDDARSADDAASDADTRGAGGQARQQAADDTQQRQRSAPQAPAAQRPHVAAQQPGFSAQRQPGFSAQRQPAAKSQAGVMAGARQAVTSRDVSASPAAPVQQRVLTLINQNRRRSGCGSLTLDRRLIEAANDHAADMARRDYFDHQSPNGDSAGDRVSGAGYRWKRYGENIARGADSAWEVVDGWMNSRTHRKNILDCRLHQMGIGLAISRDRTPYWVQDFATPDPK